MRKWFGTCFGTCSSLSTIFTGFLGLGAESFGFFTGFTVGFFTGFSISTTGSLASSSDVDSDSESVSALSVGVASLSSDMPSFFSNHVSLLPKLPGFRFSFL